MNQSLINELRALDVKIRVELNKLGEFEDANDASWATRNLRAELLAADANCLNGIAVLVAANKR